MMKFLLVEVFSSFEKNFIRHVKKEGEYVDEILPTRWNSFVIWLLSEGLFWLNVCIFFLSGGLWSVVLRVVFFSKKILVRCEDHKIKLTEQIIFKYVTMYLHFLHVAEIDIEKKNTKINKIKKNNDLGFTLHFFFPNDIRRGKNLTNSIISKTSTKVTFLNYFELINFLNIILLNLIIFSRFQKKGKHFPAMLHCLRNQKL